MGAGEIDQFLNKFVQAVDFLFSYVEEIGIGSKLRPFFAQDLDPSLKVSKRFS